MAAAAGELSPDDLQERMLHDTPWFSENVPLIIVTKAKKRVAFKWTAPQLKVWRAKERQRKAGKPIRILTLKCRQWGCSTLTVAMETQTVAQVPDRNCRIVAHRMDAAQNLFRMHERMVANMPEDLRPEIAAYRKDKFIEYGEPSVAARLRGDEGLNSRVQVDTATELGGGRSDTISDLHCSEVGFYPDIAEKLSSLLEAVPYEFGTFVHLESTANGANEWQELCNASMAGENEYEFIFVGWWEEPTYAREFANEADRQAFIKDIGSGPIGKAEPDLLKLFEREGIDYEAALRKLHWRRWKINQPEIKGDLQKFMREYPATPEDAFLSSENTVFSQIHVAKVVERTRDTDALAETGLILTGETRIRRGRISDVEVPVSALWVPEVATGFGPLHEFWKVWEHPYRAGDVLPKLNPGYVEGGENKAARDGQYIVSVDSAGDETINTAEGDWDAIEVIDHFTGRQVAEYVARRDSDELALEALLAALYWNEAVLAVEKTGNYGVPILLRLAFDFGYVHLYRRPRAPDDRKQKESDRLGWDTQTHTKRVIVDLAKELLRTDADGIRSLKLALEMQTYVKDDRGRMGARKGKHDDRLMAWMIGHQVGRETMLRPDKRPGQSQTSWVHKPTDPLTGW